MAKNSKPLKESRARDGVYMLCPHIDEHGKKGWLRKFVSTRHSAIRPEDGMHTVVYEKLHADDPEKRWRMDEKKPAKSEKPSV